MVMYSIVSHGSVDKENNYYSRFVFFRKCAVYDRTRALVFVKCNLNVVKKRQSILVMEV